MAAQAGGHGNGPHHRLGGQVVADPAVFPARDERLDHRGQPAGGQVGHGVRAGLQGGRGGRVARVDAHQHLAALEAHLRDGGRVVPGEPVVDLEDRLGQAAPVHRADHHLALERAEEQQVLQHVGGAEHAVDAGPAQGHAQPLEQAGAVRHGGLAPAGPQDAARRMVSGDQHQAAGERGGPLAPGRRLRHHLGPPRADLPDLGHPLSEHGRSSDSLIRWSAGNRGRTRPARCRSRPRAAPRRSSRCPG